jgi:DNA-binding CsgD family transcriptional regulator
MLEAADGITLAGGRIKIEGAERQAALTVLIDKARAGEPGEMALQRPSGRRPLDLFLRPVDPPIDPHEASADTSLRGVALFIVDPDRQPPQSHGLLREAFGLTRTEAEIARRLASGASIEEIAAATHTSVGTARNHVKRVLAKTRTSRQAELVALIANRPILDLPFR